MEKRSPEGLAAKKAYSSAYSKEHYELITLTVLKGEKEPIKHEAKKRGITLTKLFMTAVKDYTARNPL